MNMMEVRSSPMISEGSPGVLRQFSGISYRNVIKLQI